METSEANKEAARKLRQSGGIVIPCQSAVTLYKAEGDPLSWEIIEHGISAVIARDRS